MFRSLFPRIVGPLVLAGTWACGQTLEIGRTSVLSVNLPESTSWQVERWNRGTWTGTGVLVGGRGETVSVRINTGGDQGPFRLRQIGGEEAVLTPVVSASWHVKGTVPPVGTGAGQDAGLVLIEKSSDLSEWLPETVLYARIGGEFVRSLAGEFPLVPFGSVLASSHFSPSRLPKSRFDNYL